MRKLRVGHGLSVEKLAFKANISASTLRRWENGDTFPQIANLTFVFNVLDIDVQEQHKYFALLDAPRAIAYQRSQVSETDPMWAWMPGAGDLWRAMRLRRGLTGKQIAVCLGVDPGRVTKWEQSKVAPDKEQRTMLFDLLGASAQERATLTQCSLSFTSVAPTNSIALDAFEERLRQMQRHVENRSDIPSDICYIAMETQLWPLALHGGNALRLLSMTWSHHAQFLMWEGRNTEMNVYAHRALEISEGQSGLEASITQANRCYAHYLWQVGGQRGTKRALQLLNDWLCMVVGNEFRNGIYREMAEYAGTVGQYERAFELLNQSRQIALETTDVGALRLADIVEARVLLRAKRPADAIRLLPTDEHISSNQRVFELLLWTEAQLELGDHAEAAVWLNRFYDHINRHNIPHQRWQGNALAQRL